MGFGNIVESAMELEPVDEGNAYASDLCGAVRALAGVAELMSAVEATYRAQIRPARLAIKAAANQFVGTCPSAPACDPASTVLEEKAVYTMSQLTRHATSADEDVQRWARTAVAVRDAVGEERLRTLCRHVARSFPVLADTASTTLTWTMSECNRRKAYIVPFQE